MKTAYNLRSIAAQAISQVLDKGLSLSTVLPGLQKMSQIKIVGYFRNSASVPYGFFLSWNGVCSN